MAVLIDDSPSMVEWASPGGAHCRAHCQHGHCGSIVKVLKGEGRRVSRIGKKLAGFDALEAGAFVARPELFDTLHRLLVESIYCTLAEAMQVFASEGQLEYIAVEGLDWFGEQTVASLPMLTFSPAVVPEWRERALALLRITSPNLRALSGTLVPKLGQEGEEMYEEDEGEEVVADGSVRSRRTSRGPEQLSMQICALGSTIGTGGSSV